MITTDEDTILDPSIGEWIPRPRIRRFESNKLILTDYSPATIEWEVSGATAVYLNEQPVEPIGSILHWAAQRTDFILSIELSGQSIEARCIIIDIDDTPPTIVYFGSDKHYGIQGFPIQLSWEVENANHVIIDNFGVVAAQGQRSLTVNEQGTFRLVATGNFGTVTTVEIAVMVIPTPLITSLQVPVPDFQTTVNLSDIQVGIPVFNIRFQAEMPRFSQSSKMIELSKLYTEYRRKQSTLNAWQRIRELFSFLNT